MKILNKKSKKIPLKIISKINILTPFVSDITNFFNFRRHNQSAR